MNKTADYLRGAVIFLHFVERRGLREIARRTGLAKNTVAAIIHNEPYRSDPSRGIPHGTLNGFTNYWCRCDSCKEAMRAYQKSYYQRTYQPRNRVIVGRRRHLYLDAEYGDRFDATNRHERVGPNEWSDPTGEEAIER